MPEAGSDAAARAITWFVTRKFPPRVGGAWRHSAGSSLRGSAGIDRLACLRCGEVIPAILFLGHCALSIFIACLRGRVAILHLGDPVLAPLGCIAKALGVPVAVTVHGLDVIYESSLYRAWLAIFAFRRFDAYICISSAARDAATERGVPRERTTVIGIGITVPAPRAVKRDSDVLLFVGRLIPRKGLAWFVADVLPRLAVLRPRARLKVIGAGPEKTSIGKAAAASAVGDRIEWIGAASDAERSRLRSSASVCIVPNVPVEGDMEGYGLVALEAAVAGLPRPRSRSGGTAGCAWQRRRRSGPLPSKDSDAWVAAAAELLADPEQASLLWSPRAGLGYCSTRLG